MPRDRGRKGQGLIRRFHCRIASSLSAWDLLFCTVRLGAQGGGMGACRDVVLVEVSGFFVEQRGPQVRYRTTNEMSCIKMTLSPSHYTRYGVSWHSFES